MLPVRRHGNGPRVQASERPLRQVSLQSGFLSPIWFIAVRCQSPNGSVVLHLRIFLFLCDRYRWPQGGKRSGRIRGPEVQQQPVRLHLHLGSQHRLKGEKKRTAALFHSVLLECGVVETSSTSPVLVVPVSPKEWKSLLP